MNVYTFDSLSSSPTDGGVDGFSSSTNINGSWTLNTNTAYSRGGSGKSAKLTITSVTYPSAGDDNISVAYINKTFSNTKGTEMWIQFWMYSPTALNLNSVSNLGQIIKFLSMQYSTSADHMRAYLANAGSYAQGWPIGHAGWWVVLSDGVPKQNCTPFFPVMFYPSNNNPCPDTWDSGSETQLTSSFFDSQWHSYELYWYFHEGVNSGIQRIWVDGDLEVELRLATLLTSSSVNDKNPFLFHTWNNGVNQTVELYIDDIIITNDRPSSQDEFGNYMIGAGTIIPTVSISATDSQASE